MTYKPMFNIKDDKISLEPDWVLEKSVELSNAIMEAGDNAIVKCLDNKALIKLRKMCEAELQARALTNG